MERNWGLLETHARYLVGNPSEIVWIGHRYKRKRAEETWDVKSAGWMRTSSYPSELKGMSNYCTWDQWQPQESGSVQARGVLFYSGPIGHHRLGGLASM